MLMGVTSEWSKMVSLQEPGVHHSCSPNDCYGHFYDSCLHHNDIRDNCAALQSTIRMKNDSRSNDSRIKWFKNHWQAFKLSHCNVTLCGAAAMLLCFAVQWVQWLCFLVVVWWFTVVVWCLNEVAPHRNGVSLQCWIVALLRLCWGGATGACLTVVMKMLHCEFAMPWILPLCLPCMSWLNCKNLQCSEVSKDSSILGFAASSFW